MLALRGLLVLVNAAHLRREPLPNFLSLLSRYNNETQKNYGPDAKPAFVADCQTVVAMRFEEYLPTAAIRAMCETVDRRTECVEHADKLVATFRAGTGDYSKWCSDFYEWFEEQHGDLCPKQCSKFMCKPKCAWLAHIAELDEAEAELIAKEAENEEKRKEVETTELEIKEMKFEHDQLNNKLEVANTHVERVEADLADERKKLEEAVNKTSRAEDKATARDVIVADLVKTIKGTEENLTKLGFHLDEVSVRAEGQKREARRFTQIEKESEKELLVMLGEAENAGDKVSDAEKRLETELAEINATNLTLQSKRADLEAKQASAEAEVRDAQERVDRLESLQNKTADEVTELKMEKVMLDDKNRVANEVMTALAALVKEEKKLAGRAFEAKYLRKDLEKREDLLAEVMAKAKALNGTLNESVAAAQVAWAKANDTADEIEAITAEKAELAANLTSFEEKLKTAKITAGFAHEALKEKQDAEGEQQERVTEEEYSLSRAEDEVTTLTVEETELDEDLNARINATKDAKHAYELAANATAKAKADLAAERDLAEAREPAPN
jgi:chromosome segregation ATPase